MKIIYNQIIWIEFIISYVCSFKHETYFVWSVGCGIFVRIGLPRHKDAKIEIYNTLGKMILDSKIPSNNGSIDVSNVWPGVYIYIIKDEINILQTGIIIK